MLIGFAALIVGLCPAHYSQNSSITIGFQPGSLEISSEARLQIAELVTPVAGNALAEVHADAYFPYGEGDIENSGSIARAAARLDEIRSAVVSLGVDTDLIGTGRSALGWGYKDGAYVHAPYPVEQLETVDVSVRVKSDCHPLADLARRLDPYR